ncbi:MAG: hypothetical protein PHY16_16250 [Methylobacter sp.]|nr:hypothetical protein [Methylobacter sp.]
MSKRSPYSHDQQRIFVVHLILGVSKSNALQREQWLQRVVIAIKEADVGLATFYRMSAYVIFGRASMAHAVCVNHHGLADTIRAIFQYPNCNGFA